MSFHRTGILAARDGRAIAARRGFTLVEMIVSITLVLIMMLMFAQVFEIASKMNGTVRGLSRNDQRSRILSTLIRGDLEKRSFRYLVPFANNETGHVLDYRLDERQGYFYISENDPADDTDDVLQLTVRSVILRTNDDPTPYYGLTSANPVGTREDVNGNGVLDAGEDLNNNGILDIDPNRQEMINASNGAEIAYFLRNGVLYRRIVLLYKSIGGRSQPFDNNGVEMFDVNQPTPYQPHPGPDGRWNTSDDWGNFWKDFDFSAHYTIRGTKLHNEQSFINRLNESTYPLGFPAHRFGHDHATGYPREFVPGPGPDNVPNTADDGPYFTGRFTHEETSHYAFRYPQLPSPFNDGNPMKRSAASSNPLSVGVNGVVEQYRGGYRRGEDILMSNVHSFDIKVWDEQAFQFVDIGHALTDSNNNATGHYHFLNRKNLTYGPIIEPVPGNLDLKNRVFDTWHPKIGANNPPPYRPTYYETSVPSQHRKGTWSRSEDTNGNGQLDPGEDINNNGQLDMTAYAVGNVVFPRSEANGPLAFRCIAIAGHGFSMNVPPLWPDSALRLVTETEDVNHNGQLDPFEDRNGNNLLDSITWQAMDNWLPLKAIQITIRFRDPNSELIRQMTQVISLVN